MKQGKSTSIFYLLAALFMLGLVGCEPPAKEGIAEWKAEGNVEKLLVALGDADRRMSIPAAQALGEMKSEEAVDPLAALLTHTDSQLVVAAIQALISIGTESVETHLITALELEDSWPKKMAINGLGTMKSTQAIDPLVELLNTSDERIATAAAVSLGLINDPKSIAPLAAKVESPTYSFRLACVESISSIGGKEATEALAVLIGDDHSAVREIAINTLIASGSFAAPYALDALHGKNAQARQSAAIILEGIDAVPSGGKLRIFYLIAKMPPQAKGIDDSIVMQLAEIGKEAIPILIKAVSHKAPNIREHAFRALETIGEPCVAQTVKAVETRATPAGKQWFNKRTSWEGAPSWRLDLWGAAAALNPEFKPPYAQSSGMTEKGYATQTLQATQREVPREYIPLLIPLLAPVGGHSDDGMDSSQSVGLFGSSSRSRTAVIDFHEIAEQRLVSAGDIALFPLIAATDSNSKQIANACKKLLLRIESSLGKSQ